MSDSIVTKFEFASTTIRNDGLVNATALTTAYRNATGIRKDVRDWLKIKEAEASISYLSRATGIPVADLVIVENGVGTWFHPDLAEIFAQWVSVEYRFAVVALIRREKEATQTPVTQLALPCHELAVQKANAIRHITDTLYDNPRLAQLLIDQSINDIVEQKALPASQSPQRRGVAEIATEMGYKIDMSSRVKLGQFIKAQGFESDKEKRLCNGMMTEINCYYDTPELREAIAAFFDH